MRTHAIRTPGQSNPGEQSSSIQMDAAALFANAGRQINQTFRPVEPGMAETVRHARQRYSSVLTMSLKICALSPSMI
jgi:hypothetical protein